jgi:hypothetical protein
VSIAHSTGLMAALPALLVAKQYQLALLRLRLLESVVMEFELNAPYFNFDVPLKRLHLKEEQNENGVAVPLWIE